MVDPITEEAYKPACVQAPDMWFDGEAVPLAIRTCQSCPLVLPCLEAALAEEAGLSVKQRHGIRGGLRPAQRARLDQVDNGQRETIEVGQ